LGHSSSHPINSSSREQPSSLQENRLLLFVEPAADTLAVVALVALVDSSPLVEVDNLEEDNHKAAGVDTLLVGKDSRNPCQP